MTRAGNYSDSLCLLSGAFARYLQVGLRNFDDLPANGELVAQRTKAAKSAVSLLSVRLLFVRAGIY